MRLRRDNSKRKEVKFVGKKKNVSMLACYPYNSNLFKMEMCKADIGQLLLHQENVFTKLLS